MTGRWTAKVSGILLFWWFPGKAGPAHGWMLDLSLWEMVAGFKEGITRVRMRLWWKWRSSSRGSLRRKKNKRMIFFFYSGRLDRTEETREKTERRLLWIQKVIRLQDLRLFWRAGFQLMGGWTFFIYGGLLSTLNQTRSWALWSSQGFCATQVCYGWSEPRTRFEPYRVCACANLCTRLAIFATWTRVWFTPLKRSQTVISAARLRLQSHATYCRI